MPLPQRYLTLDVGRSYIQDMNTTTSNTWKYQHETSTVQDGAPTDARGLKLRRDSGYTHVYMGQSQESYDGWLQINVAIAKLEIHERMSVLKAAIDALR
jgi:hypothetical protein